MAPWPRAPVIPQLVDRKTFRDNRWWDTYERFPSPTREAVCRSSGKTRHGAYLEYTQNIVLQHQGENPTGKPDTPTPHTSVSSGTPKRGTTSRLTGAGSLLSPVYSEAWAKGNAEVSPGHHFPPYGTPHTANIRVEKPTVLVENK
ncbi:hypothetical protein TNCV_3826721 [Trichonephila clavipes]|nr:hypothetical protein TNCV_3826721 [Trichonephila clavipes]